VSSAPALPAPRVRFWSYDAELPSFRHRLAPLAAELARRGVEVAVERFPKRRYVRRILERRSPLAATDLLVFAKINLAPLEGWLLRRSVAAAVFDFDDAIFLRRPRAVGAPPGRSPFRRAKFARSCRAASLVVAGNEFLADAARQHARRVAVVPTPVDLERHAEGPPGSADGQVLVWIGLPENLPYLELVRPALARLAAERPGLRLRVVSSRAPAWPEVAVEHVPWSADGEAAALASADVGLMPLTDDDWSRGKCSFKLLQYMAAGLPCVASPVGMNREVVVDGETGLWAPTVEAWEAALRRLLDSRALRVALGAAGRELVRTSYDRRVVVPRAVELLLALVAASGGGVRRRVRRNGA